MKTTLASLACGLVFALGLGISGMTLPSKVLGFLDLAGAWDPSLALVMAAALTVLVVARAVALSKPLLAESFSVPARHRVDARLVAGAGLFGVGWGLGGFCPGPGLVSLGAGSEAAVVFVVAMALGMQAHRLFERWLPEVIPEGSREGAAAAPSGTSPKACG